MIYAALNVFKNYAAFVTANDETGFRDIFRDVVWDCLRQVENRVGSVEDSHRERIKNDMAVLQPVPREQLVGFAYDLQFNVHGLMGKIEVAEVFFTKEEVFKRFQSWVDECNKDVENEEELWAVFDGGFFQSTQGYEVDDLFT